MKHYGPIGRREQPCPDDSVSLEEAILDQLDNLDPDVMQAYAEFCAERMEVPEKLIAALIPLLNYKRRWESVRSRTDEALGDALDEIVYAIDKQQAAFIEHHAAQLRSKAEQIEQSKQEAA
jgi:hypothetical protein